MRDQHSPSASWRHPSRPEPEEPPARPSIPGARVAGAALALVTVLVILASPAAAVQDIAFELDCPTAPKTIKPASDPGIWECTAVLTYQSASTGLTDPTQPAIVGLETPDPASWMTPVVAPSTIATSGPGSGEEVVEVPVTVTVGLDPNAPAFRTENLWIRPYVIQHPRNEGELSRISVVEHNNLSVTPGYLNRYDVRLVTHTAKARPQEPLRYALEIDNYSNGLTRFEFSIPTENLGGFVPLPPESVVVPGVTATGSSGNATGGGGNGTSLGANSITVPFEVQTPYSNGYVNERAALQVRVDSSFELDRSLTGASSLVSTIATAEGTYVPGPGAPAIALVAVGAALVLRRTRP